MRKLRLFRWAAVLTLAILLCTSAAARAFAAASLTPLGGLPGGTFASAPTGISADGSVIVGASTSGSGHEAFRWTSDGGMVGLGNLPGGFYSQAYGVSADGSVIVGYDTSASGYEAFRWTAAGGMQGLGDLPGGVFDSEAIGVSGDGSVIVGRSFSDFDTEAFRLTSDGGMVGLGYLPGGDGSWARGISGDGSVIVGYGTSASGVQAFRWTSDGGMVGLGHLPGDFFYSEARGVSADGSVIVGGSTSGSAGYEAFRWTSDGGMVGLGYLPGGVGSEAIGVSGDGSVVVGSSNLDPGSRAFFWTADGGMRDLWDLLLSHGVDPAANGWTQLYSAQGISADGSTIVGTGLRNNNSEAFVAVIPNAPLAGDFNNNGHLDATDIDALTEEILTGGMGAAFDLNGDGTVDGTDRVVWINELKGTFLGDSNLDGEFNSADLVDAFAAGQYEDGIEGNSTWSTGDWDGTADFDTSDLVAAFSEGAYEQGPRASAVAAVPEPSSLISLLVAIGGLCVLIRQRLG